MTEQATTTYCEACQLPREPGAAFCSRCGAPLPAIAADPPSGGLPPVIPPPPPGATSFVSSTAPEATDEPYPSINVLVACALTIGAPFISLVAAIVLLQDQRIAARRSQLKSWAVASGVWLAVGGVIFISIVASIGGGGLDGPGTSGTCKGGIDRMIPPDYYSQDGQNWTATYTCVNGGTLQRPSHAAWLNQ